MDDVSSDSCTLQNLTIHNGYNGIYIKGSNHIIQNNTIYTISHSGIYSFQTKNTYNHVRQNEVSYCSYNGIDIVGASNHYWRIYRNYVHHSNNGIELSGQVTMRYGQMFVSTTIRIQLTCWVVYVWCRLI